MDCLQQMNIKKFMKHRAIGIVVFTFIMLQAAVGQNHREKISLEECLKIALSNNSSLKLEEINLKKTGIDRNQSHFNRLPGISGYVGHGFSKGRSVDPTTNQFTEQTFGYGNQSLSADFTIFNGFKTLHDIRAKANAFAAGKEDLNSAILNLKLDVIEAYIQVQAAKDIWEQSKKQLLVTEEQMRRAEVMHNEGAFAPNDYYDLKGQLKKEMNQVENGFKTYKFARLALAKILELPENELGELQILDLKISDALLSSENLYQKASEELPDIRALDYRIRQSISLYRMSKGDYFPSISLGAGISGQFSNKVNAPYFEQFQNNLGRSISIGLRVPIFNRLQTYHQVKKANLSIEEAKLQKTIQLENLRQSTSQAVFDLENTIGSVRNLEEQVILYTESFRIAQVHFDSGAINSFAYLVAKAKLDNSKQELLIKKNEYILQKYIHDYYSGNLNL